MSRDAGGTALEGPAPPPDEARRYSRVKLAAGLADTLLVILLLALLMASGLSLAARRVLARHIANPYLLSLACGLAVGAAGTILSFPLSFYGGYILEHRHRLSRQTFGAWLREQAKGLAVGLALFVPLLLAFVFFLRWAKDGWWLWTGVVLVFFSAVLARLAPVLILPLFYRFRPLEDGELEGRLRALTERAGFSLAGLYRFDLSKDTVKANAALTGLGRTRRIILGDTLLERFTPGEIEAVVAHELGHHRRRHIPILLAAGTILTFLGLWLTHLGIAWAAALFRGHDPAYGGLDDPAFLPLFALFLALYGLVTGPLQNALSRRLEYQADSEAVRTGPGAGPFISALEKLSRQNLADPDPHPVVEFLFHSHPSISKRIAAAGRPASSGQDFRGRPG